MRVAVLQSTCMQPRTSSILTFILPLPHRRCRLCGIVSLHQPHSPPPHRRHGRPFAAGGRRMDAHSGRFCSHPTPLGSRQRPHLSPPRAGRTQATPGKSRLRSAPPPGLPRRTATGAWRVDFKGSRPAQGEAPVNGHGPTGRGFRSTLISLSQPILT